MHVSSSSLNEEFTRHHVIKVSYHVIKVSCHVIKVSHSICRVQGYKHLSGVQDVGLYVHDFPSHETYESIVF